MIWAFLFYLMYGSSGGSGAGFGELATKYLKDQVRVAVSDEERRERAVGALSVMTDDIADLNKGVSKHLKQFEELVQDYDTEPTDFDRYFEIASEEHLRQLEKIGSDREALLEHVRPNEWKAIIAGARAEQEEGSKK